MNHMQEIHDLSLKVGENERAYGIVHEIEGLLLSGGAIVKSIALF